MKVKEKTKTKEKTEAGEVGRLDAIVSLPKFQRIDIADDPGFYDDKYFPDWLEKNITCVGITEDFKEVLIPKNFSRRCHASRWIRNRFPNIEIRQWYY